MKRRLIGLFVILLLSCTACGKEDTTQAGDLQSQVQEVMDDISYDNLEILFDEIDGLEGQEIVVANARFQSPAEGLSKEEAVKLYATEIFPRLLDMETIDTKLIYDLTTSVDEQETQYRVRTYEKDYEDILASIETYEEMPFLVYANNDTWTELYYMGDWFSGVYITQGKLGSLRPSMSAFGAYRVIEDVKEYDCRLDDLSDSYMLMDGEKTVAEAKKEIEEYLDAHYPLTGEDNGIQNDVYKIFAGKVSGTEYYAFRAHRTLSYNGIPFRETPTNHNDLGSEFFFMGENAMCESNKLDVTIGLINCYAKPEIERVITEFVPFQDVMDSVAHYLTGATKFQLIRGCLEYRVFEQEEGKRLVPYWCFVAKNPNDDSMLKIYVDMETGEIESWEY